MSQDTETAILAGGCFWPAQELLRRRDGVISTRVGYTGGENDHQTADNHPGHAEAVEVIFDPGRTSYRDILEFFFQIHRPDLGEGLAPDPLVAAAFARIAILQPQQELGQPRLGPGARDGRV